MHGVHFQLVQVVKGYLPSKKASDAKNQATGKADKHNSPGLKHLLMPVEVRLSGKDATVMFQQHSMEVDCLNAASMPTCLQSWLLMLGHRNACCRHCSVFSDC